MHLGAEQVREVILLLQAWEAGMDRVAILVGFTGPGCWKLVLDALYDVKTVLHFPSWPKVLFMTGYYILSSAFTISINIIV